MLPGFRFLFAAIVLSMSVLVFGLGAAALLRAAHETFASTPSWHTSPETTFAQPSDASRPVLSMLRVDPPVAEKAPDNAPAVTAAPVATAPSEPVATAPTPPPEQATTTPPPAEPEQRVATLQPVDSPAPAAAKPDGSIAENPPQEHVAPAQDDTAAPQAATPATADQTRVAATTATSEQQPPPSEAAPAAEVAAVAEVAPAASEPASDPSAADTETFSTTIATLGGPPVNIGPVAKKAADPKPDKSATKRHDQAKREHRHRRIAARAQLAQTQAPVDPFGQPTIAPIRSRKPR
jgi:hypothetical protein